MRKTGANIKQNCREDKNKLLTQTYNDIEQRKNECVDATH